MNEVQITFAGVCTHVTNVPMTPPPDAVAGEPLPAGRYLRTILVDGSLGVRLGDQGIPPHEAYLVIPTEFLDSIPGPIPGLHLVAGELGMIWRMDGVALYIADAAAGVELGLSVNDLPSLTDRSDALSLQLDPRVVVDGRSAARFDVFAGHLEAFQYKEAVHTKLTVRTTAPKPELVITRMWDQKRTTLKLKDSVIDGEETPPQVFVMNIGTDADKPLDFLLHYDVTTWTPDPDDLPTAGDVSNFRPMNSRERLFKRFMPGGLTVGCSNSIYP